MKRESSNTDPTTPGGAADARAHTDCLVLIDRANGLIRDMLDLHTAAPYDRFVELTDIAEQLPVVCGEPAEHVALQRVWRDLLEVLARGRTGRRVAAARREFVLSTARLLVLPNQQIGCRQTYYLHLRRELACLPKTDCDRLAVLDPEHAHRMILIRNEFKPRAIRPVSSRTAQGIISRNGTDRDGLGRAQLPEPVWCLKKHPAPLTRRRVPAKPVPAPVHGADRPQGTSVSAREVDQTHRTIRIQPARYCPRTVSCDEAQYLGNGGAGHWSNPRSHD